MEENLNIMSRSKKTKLIRIPGLSEKNAGSKLKKRKRDGSEIKKSSQDRPHKRRKLESTSIENPFKMKVLSGTSFNNPLKKKEVGIRFPDFIKKSYSSVSNRRNPPIAPPKKSIGLWKNSTLLTEKKSVWDNHSISPLRKINSEKKSAGNYPLKFSFDYGSDKIFAGGYKLKKDGKRKKDEKISNLSKGDSIPCEKCKTILQSSELKIVRCFCISGENSHYLCRGSGCQLKFCKFCKKHFCSECSETHRLPPCTKCKNLCCSICIKKKKKKNPCVKLICTSCDNRDEIAKRNFSLTQTIQEKDEEIGKLRKLVGEDKSVLETLNLDLIREIESLKIQHAKDLELVKVGHVGKKQVEDMKTVFNLTRGKLDKTEEELSEVKKAKEILEKKNEDMCNELKKANDQLERKIKYLDNENKVLGNKISKFDIEKRKMRLVNISFGQSFTVSQLAEKYKILKLEHQRLLKNLKNPKNTGNQATMETNSLNSFMSTWTCEDVKNFVDSILEGRNYGILFVNHSVNGKALSELKTANFERIGVKKQGEIVLLMKKIKEKNDEMKIIIK